ncbi:MAG: TIR domain-containing protein [Burkholderiales bacterium]|nr:TIR domain-containing protein [Burkholderiales bacterium]
MADLFVSYASADREKAQLLAETLIARGYSVWWDRTIPPGRIFDEVIQEALNAAKCVIVLWSQASVKSNWVKTEAAEAQARDILVPAIIENAPLPIEFKRIQSANLTDWDGETRHREFAGLLKSIELMVNADPGHSNLMRAKAGPGAASSPTRAGRKITTIAAIAGAVLLGLAGSAWLLNQRGAGWSSPNGKAEQNAFREPLQDQPLRNEPSPTNGLAPPNAPAPRASSSQIVDQPLATKIASAKPAATGTANLLASEDGGQIVVASSDSWAKTIDGKEDHVYIKGEGVFAFRDEQLAIFDTFTALIPGTAEWNIKEFELLAADDGPTGRFESIGKFTTQNVKLFKTPYQEFKFPPAKARYLKVRLLSAYRGGEEASAYEFQLFGTLAGK